MGQRAAPELQETRTRQHHNVISNIPKYHEKQCAEQTTATIKTRKKVNIWKGRNSPNFSR